MLEGRRETLYPGYAYTSASVNTAAGKSFQYGYFEMSAQLPKGQGMWPAFWMLGTNIGEVDWPFCGEIDIMEMVGGEDDNKIYGTAHWNEGAIGHRYTGGNSTLAGGVFNDAFHRFGVLWTPEVLAWYLDGNEYYRLDITDARFDAFRKPMYVLLNLAIGGDWPGSPDEKTQFPARYAIDYVRVYAAQQD